MPTTLPGKFNGFMFGSSEITQFGYWVGQHPNGEWIRVNVPIYSEESKEAVAARVGEGYRLFLELWEAEK